MKHLILRVFMSREIAEKHQLTYGLGSQFLEALSNACAPSLCWGLRVCSQHFVSAFTYSKSDISQHLHSVIYSCRVPSDARNHRECIFFSNIGHNSTCSSCPSCLTTFHTSLNKIANGTTAIFSNLIKLSRMLYSSLALGGSGALPD